MATHTNHPPIESNGLADGCGRCREQAENPWSELDVTNLRNLLWRTLGKKEPRSRVETLAMVNVADVLERAGKLYAASPEIVISRLMDFRG